MVPTPHRADDPDAPDGWLKALRVVIRLASTGLVVLLNGAHDALARELVELLREAPGPEAPAVSVRVIFTASELLDAPVGARVVLVQPGPSASWLNFHRPVVRERRLCLLLWCTEGCAQQLRAGAPDFMDWVSHRLDLPPSLPKFLRTALESCEANAEVLALTRAPPPPVGWTALSVAEGYRSLREALRRGPVWLSGVRNAHHCVSALVARSESGAQHGLVLADPETTPETVQALHAAPMAWKEAAALLEARGEPEPGVAAALVDLEPGALGLIPETPRSFLLNADWQQLIAGAAQGVDRRGLALAEALSLTDIAQCWREELGEGPREVAPEVERFEDGRSVAPSWGRIAEILQARGSSDEALRILREEELPALDRLGDVRDRALTMGKIADILQAQGQLDEALRIRRGEELPVFEQLGDIRERAVTQSRIADILQTRGQLDEALRIRREEELPVFEQLGDIRSRAVTLGNIAGILQTQGQLDEAIRIVREEELPVYEQLGLGQERLIAQTHLALNLLRRGAPGDEPEAQRLLQAALASAEALQLPEAAAIRGILQQQATPPKA